MPANAIQFLLQGRFGSSDGGVTPDAGSPFDSLRIFRAAGDGGTAEVEVELLSDDLGQGMWRFTPTEPIAAGTDLRLEHTQTCHWDSQTQQTNSTVHVVAAAPAPTQLGTLEIEVSEGSLLLTDDSASCATNYQSAYADLKVMLSSSAARYADVLRYSILVDGELFDQDGFDFSAEEDGWITPSLGGSPLGRGVGRIYATCTQFDPEYNDFRPHPLAPGKHQVQMVAHLPDGTSLATEEHEVTLALTQCTVPDAGDSGSVEMTDSAVDAGDSGSVVAIDSAVDASSPALPDAQTPVDRDAASRPDARPSVSSTSDAASPAAARPPAPRRKSGCSIAHAPGSTPGSPWLWALAMGLVWSGRRKWHPVAAQPGAR